MPIEPIKDTVHNVIQELMARKTRMRADDPWLLLGKALAKKELRHIKFHYFKKGVLSLYVDSSSRLYALSLQKENLLRKLSNKSCAIKDIRFRIGEFKDEKGKG